MLNQIKTTPIIYDLSHKVIGIYGHAGIGKSRLASCFDNVLFAQTEAGLSHLNIDRVIVLDWTSPLTVNKFDNALQGGFLSLCSEFIKGEHKYKVLAIDTFDNLAKLCTEWKCQDLNIEDIQDYKKFGAYHLVTAELHRVITKLSQSSYGLILTSHLKQIEKETKTKKWNKDTVSISGQNANVMLDICDILLYMGSRMDGENEIGVIKTKPSMFWEAKDKNALLPEEIIYPLNQPEKAYQIIKDCYSKGKERNAPKIL